MKVTTAVEIFKALGDETRIRILYLFLKSQEELCVCELTDALEVSQYNISRHLKILTAAGLLQRQKIGRWVYFRLPSPAPSTLAMIYQAVASLSDAQLNTDLAELDRRLSLRTNGRCTIGIQKPHLKS